MAKHRIVVEIEGENITVVSEGAPDTNGGDEWEIDQESDFSPDEQREIRAILHDIRKSLNDTVKYSFP